MIRENLSLGRGWVRTAAVFSLVWVAACIEGEDAGMTDPASTNEPPVAVGLVPPVTVTAGEHVLVDVSVFFQDPDGDPLIYGASTTNALVAGASISGSTMTVVGVSTGMAGGAIFARDTTGGEAVQSFAVTVPNQVPLAVRPLPALTLLAGQAERIDLASYFRDPEGDALTFGATTANALVVGVSVAGSTLTVGAVAPGSTTITVTARDPAGGEVVQDAPVVVRRQ